MGREDELDQSDVPRRTRCWGLRSPWRGAATAVVGSLALQPLPDSPPASVSDRAGPGIGFAGWAGLDVLMHRGCTLRPAGRQPRRALPQSSCQAAALTSMSSRPGRTGPGRAGQDFSLMGQARQRLLAWRSARPSQETGQASGDLTLMNIVNIHEYHEYL